MPPGLSSPMLSRALCLFLLASAAHATCADALNLVLAKGTVTQADTVAAGQLPNFKALPAFCRVQATLKPTEDSDIRVEVWMPVTGWNQKFQGVGNGAWAGTMAYPAMAQALTMGYATASTDTGHQGNSGTFVLGHPQRLVDFAYRAVHEMTLTAKAVIRANYRTNILFSYFNGCSTGGRQAFAEMQRYPNDYSGIVAGAPAYYTTRLQGSQVWTEKAAHADGAYIPPAKYKLIHGAVLSACDAKDGVTDGVLEDPKACKFDPQALLCKGADAADCLTAPQAELARKIYSGPGKFPGYEPGSELGWQSHAGPEPGDYSAGIYKYAVFQDPSWSYLSFDFARDVAVAEKKIPFLNSVDVHLKPFFARGGKLIQYHGWADPGIPPQMSIDYFDRVTRKMGAASQSSYRLFMVPGMGHCRGGDGTDTFDMMAALEQWAEKGKAPDSVSASRLRDGKVDRTRPLCPYPQTAHYQGSGSTEDASNFTCSAGR